MGTFREAIQLAHPDRPKQAIAMEAPRASPWYLHNRPLTLDTHLRVKGQGRAFVELRERDLPMQSFVTRGDKYGADTQSARNY